MDKKRKSSSDERPCGVASASVPLAPALTIMQPPPTTMGYTYDPKKAPGIPGPFLGVFPPIFPPAPPRDWQKFCEVSVRGLRNKAKAEFLLKAKSKRKKQDQASTQKIVPLLDQEEIRPAKRRKKKDAPWNMDDSSAIKKDVKKEFTDDAHGLVLLASVLPQHEEEELARDDPKTST